MKTAVVKRSNLRLFRPNLWYQILTAESIRAA